MRIEKTITDWARWDDLTDEAVRAFQARYELTPDALLASEATLRDEDGYTAVEGQHAPMTSFLGDGYKLDVYFDAELVTGIIAVMLLGDGPDGGEEEDLPESERRAG